MEMLLQPIVLIDVAGFYQSEEMAYTEFNGRWRAGFNIQNLGPKISYDNDEISTNFTSKFKSRNRI
jgi:hypothetical protein